MKKKKFKRYLHFCQTCTDGTFVRGLANELFTSLPHVSHWENLFNYLNLIVVLLPFKCPSAKSQLQINSSYMILAHSFKRGWLLHRGKTFVSSYR